MRDYLAALNRLRKDAAEAALIRQRTSSVVAKTMMNSTSRICWSELT